MHKTGGNITIFAVALDDSDFHHITLKIRLHSMRTNFEIKLQAFGDDLAGNNAYCACLAAVGLRPETRSTDFRRFNAVAAHFGHRVTGCEQLFRNHPARRKHNFCMASFKAVYDNKIGPLSRRNKTAIKQTKSSRCRDTCRSINRERLDTTGDGRAYEIIKMAMIGNIEWITIIRAKGQKLRMTLSDNRHQSMQVFGNRAFSDQHMHTLAHFFQRFLGTCRLMLGADTGCDITIQIKPTQKRRMTIDMSALKGF